MARATCLACLVSTVSGCHKNSPVRARANSEYITKLEQSTFLRHQQRQISMRLTYHKTKIIL